MTSAARSSKRDRVIWRLTRTARARRSPGTSTKSSRTRSCSRTSASIAWCSTRSPRTRFRKRCAIRARSTRRWSTPIGRRRALDYLVGFTLSPVLWRKLPGARSAGRVQSVALRIVCDREVEIEKFVPREYWSIVAHLRTEANAPFSARLVGADGKKISRLDIGSGAEAEAFKTALERALFSVASVESKPVKRHPYPPFTTSTLQQEASRKLGLAPARTMQIAQRLYEGVDVGDGAAGLITYMRTDGVDLAPEAVAAGAACHRQGFRRRLRAGRAAEVHSQGQERAGGARSDPPTDMARRPA